MASFESAEWQQCLALSQHDSSFGLPNHSTEQSLVAVAGRPVVVFADNYHLAVATGLEAVFASMLLDERT